MSRPRAALWCRRLCFALGGVLCGAALAAWLTVPPQYQAVAILKVAATPPRVVGKTSHDRGEFQLFKSTQAELIRSGVVLTDVLKDHKISQLPSIDAHQNDAEKWLKDNIEVRFPRDAEIMVVSFRTHQKDDAVAILDRTIDFYLKNVVQSERNQRLEEEQRLASSRAAVSKEYRRGLDALNALERVHRLHSSKIGKQLALAELDAALAERRRASERLADIKLEIGLQGALQPKAPEDQTSEERTSEQEPSEQEPSEQDPSEEGTDSGDSASDESKTEIKTLVQDSLPTAPELPKHLEFKAAFFESQLREVEERISELGLELAVDSEYSSQVEAARDEMQGKRQMLAEIQQWIDRCQLERLAPDRVVLLERAHITDMRGDTDRQRFLFGSLAGFGVLLIGLGIVMGAPKR